MYRFHFVCLSPQVSTLNEVPLEGDITVPGAPAGDDDDQEFNTLDEPVKDTVVCSVYMYLIASQKNNPINTNDYTNK